MIVKSDPRAETVKIDIDTALVRVDGAILFKRILRDCQIILQFKDGDKMRSRSRGTQFIEVPLDKFVEALQKPLKIEDVIFMKPDK